MTSEIIALVMALLSHQADITELLKHIMDEPEDIDIDKILFQVDAGITEIRRLKREIEG